MASNAIGLNKKLADKTITKLNLLLANYQQLYQNLRGFHWNIKGENFYELHLKFEEFYTDANLKIDEIAERILTLGGIPFHTYSDYLKYAEIAEVKNCSSDKLILKTLTADYKKLILLERSILKIASTNEDEGTSSLLSDYIVQQEKTVWMITAARG